MVLAFLLPILLLAFLLPILLLLLLRLLLRAQQAALVILCLILALLLRRSLSTKAPGHHAPRVDVAPAVAVGGEHLVDVPVVAEPRLSVSPDIPVAGQRGALDLSDRVGVRALVVARVIHVEVVVLGVRVSLGLAPRPVVDLLVQAASFSIFPLLLRRTRRHD